ncbi:MAG: VOC family protein [Pseudomonadota bacterium]
MQLSLFTLLVPSYEAGIEAYVGQMGFTLIEDTPLDAPKRWVVVAPDPVAPPRLLLAAATDGPQRDAIGAQTGGRVMGFLETEDFARDHAKLIAAGIRFLEEPRRESYGTVAVFEDPFGNRWDLIQPAG